MRWGALVLVLASGCGFSVGVGTDSGDDEVPEGTIVEITHDLAADFDGTSTGATVAMRGAIEPAAYLPHGLHARAYLGTFVVGESTYEQLEATLGAPVGERYALIPQDFGGSRPRGLNINRDDDYTLLVDGEIRLPAGNVDVAILADDDGLMQISIDGTTWSDIVRDASGPGEGHLALAVPAAGWYPIRIAYDESFGGALLGVQVNGTDVTGPDLRAPASNAHGLVISASNEFDLRGPIAEAWVPMLEQDFTNQNPKHDIQIQNDNFTVRYTGQFLATVAGEYSFTVDVGDDELFRVMLDRVVVAEDYPGSTRPVTASIVLEPGWHDLSVDYTELQQNAHVRLRVHGGGLDGMVPPERLRPVMGAGLHLYAGSSPGTQVTIADAMGAMPRVSPVALPVTVPTAGAVIDFTDWAFDVFSRGNTFNDITVGLECPTPTAVTPTAPKFELFSSTSCAGMPLPAEVIYRFTDTAQGGGNTFVRDLTFFASYHGGETRQPYDRASTYVSRPLPTPEAIGFGRVSLVAAAHGATVTLSVRAAEDEAGLASAPWVDVADGDVPQTPVGTVAQYRVSFASDGWQLPSVDRVDIRYVTP